jgi:hypothetical protein
MLPIYSKVTEGKLLHLIHNSSDFAGRSELISPDNYLQVATLELAKGKEFEAHKHIWKTLESNLSIAQESWVIIRGSVEVTFYDINDDELESHILNPGDISITLFGGHSYRVLEDTLAYEFKTGPYFGQALDKVFIRSST